jgi:hypothetical protein
MKYYTVLSNQTIFDICLTIYGNLDYLSKMIIDNNLQVGNKISAGTQISYPNNFTPSLINYTTGLGL